MFLPCLKTKISTLLLGDVTKFRNGFLITFYLVIPPLPVFNDIVEVLLVSLIYDTPMLLSPCHIDIAPSPATLTSNKEQN
jgi:hypothetical protein